MTDMTAAIKLGETKIKHASVVERQVLALHDTLVYDAVNWSMF